MGSRIIEETGVPGENTSELTAAFAQQDLSELVLVVSTMKGDETPLIFTGVRVICTQLTTVLLSEVAGNL